MSAETNRLRKAERCYRWLLLLYPKRFRSEFGEEMLQLFRAQWRDSQLDRSALARFGFWLWLCADIGKTASREYLSQIKGRMNMRTQSRTIIPGALAFLAAFIFGLATTPFFVHMMLTPLKPRATVLVGSTGFLEFGLLWVFGFSLVAALPFLIARWFHNRKRSLTGRTSCWLLVALVCVSVTTIGYYLVVAALPPDTTRVITVRTLGLVCLIPVALLLLAAISTSFIAARYPHDDGSQRGRTR